MIADNYPHVLTTFKSTLWKDQRELAVHSMDGQEILIKGFDSDADALHEERVLRNLAAQTTVASVPAVLGRDRNALWLPYVRGIRVFNLLVELDRLPAQLKGRGAELKHLILRRCEESQRDIQRILAADPLLADARPYPFRDKVRSVLLTLCEVAGTLVDVETLDSELDLMDLFWSHQAVVPFRDATTKNMVLADPGLWLGSFASEHDRREAIVRSLEENEIPAWAGAPVVDFDFSSTTELTTPEDDVVSLLYHERTWSGAPRRAEDLVWMGRAFPKRAALTFVVRYLRFGGRKAAYRHLHPDAHATRFRHDDELFYFRELEQIVRGLWSDAEYQIPYLLELVTRLGRDLQRLPPSPDRFVASGLAAERQHYVDVFPF